MQIDIQLSAAHEPWPALRDGVRRAEDAGFGAAWVFDHFAGAMLGGTRMLECFSLLGALAGSTERIGLGTLVVNVANRNPGVLALTAASVQELSGGRLILGLGAGTAPGSRWAVEHEDLGLPLGPKLADRHARFVATLDEIDRLWGDPAAAPGKEFAASYPHPTVRPPVIVGVNSAPLARVAGQRCDGINLRADHPEFDALLGAARTARLEAGRADVPWLTTVWTRFDPALGDPSHPQRQRFAELGVDRLILVCLEPHDPDAITRTAPRS